MANGTEQKVGSYGFPEQVDIHAYQNIVQVFQHSVESYQDRPAFSNMGHTITYLELKEYADQFAGYLQNYTDLKPGDRIAIQMPNIIQYPIALFGALLSGLVVVNTNPLYTAREMEHQFNDSGATALIAFAHMGDLVESVLPKTGIKTVVITEIGDMLPTLKGTLINWAVRYVKKMVPKFNLPQATPFKKALSLGRDKAVKVHQNSYDDLAVLQYTGGTTGVAKGAMLTHGNLVANMVQAEAVLMGFLDNSKPNAMIVPLPLYHIFSFTVCCMCLMQTGNHSILITNPRDIPGFIKELKKTTFHAFCGLNTLFVALMRHPEFKDVDFSNLKMTISGGMALQKNTAEQWKALTGCTVAEGYGMTETSPIASVNPRGYEQIGSIGVPAPSTAFKLIDENENPVVLGEVGELCVQGPQVMKGYWQRPDATEKTMTKDGFLKTGDMAVQQEDGFFRIVDRKKDMIIVSGFNVYPNEIEDVLASHPDIIEVAAVGVPDEKSGEVVKVYLVSNNPNLTAEDVISFGKKALTAYKLPKLVEFREELPKTNVGKILRRKLKEENA